MNLGDPWGREPQEAPDTWDAITARRAAEAPAAPAPDPWATIEARRAYATLPPTTGGGFSIKPIHLGIGALVVVALLSLSRKG